MIGKVMVAMQTNGKSTVFMRLMAVLTVLVSAVTTGAVVVPCQAVSLEMPPIVFVQVPGAWDRMPEGGPAGGYGDGCRIVRLLPGDSTGDPKVLTGDFISARDPSVSPDGKTILFAGKKELTDHWQIYRMNSDGTETIRITGEEMDHVAPLHVGTLFYLNDTAPVGQMIYGTLARGPGGQPALFASNDDGRNPRRVTHNLFPDVDPVVIPETGRLVFSSVGKRGTDGEALSVLMAVNIDGTDLMPFTGDQAPGVNHRMASMGFDNRVYYIESASREYLQGGILSSVSRFRSLHSRKQVSPGGSGIFHSPCPLPSGDILVSRRTPGSLYALVVLDPETGRQQAVVQTSDDYHCLDAQIVVPTTPARGRSSVVGFKHKDTGVFFCMNVYATDRPEYASLVPGSVREVLVTQGRPAREQTAREQGTPKTITHAIVGRAPVEPDGSFHIRVPSETPLTFHLLDSSGNILARQHSWTWVMHGESRGCIGCHEDRELSPPNLFIDAVKKPPVVLAPDPDVPFNLKDNFTGSDL